MNADTADVLMVSPTSLMDKNLYAYCDNNPVMRADEDGEFWNIAAVTGAISGGLAASGVPVRGQIMGNAIISGVGEVVNQYKNWKQNSKSFNIVKAGLAVGTATALDALAGKIGGDGARAPKSAYKYALDNLKIVNKKVVSNVYSNSATATKVLSRATAMVQATARSTTLGTAKRFFIGGKVVQYGMAGYNGWTRSW